MVDKKVKTMNVHHHHGPVDHDILIHDHPNTHYSNNEYVEHQHYIDDSASHDYGPANHTHDNNLDTVDDGQKLDPLHAHWTHLHEAPVDEHLRSGEITD